MIIMTALGIFAYLYYVCLVMDWATTKYRLDSGKSYLISLFAFFMPIVVCIQIFEWMK